MGGSVGRVTAAAEGGSVNTALVGPEATARVLGAVGTGPQRSEAVAAAAWIAIAAAAAFAAAVGGLPGSGGSRAGPECPAEPGHQVALVAEPGPPAAGGRAAGRVAGSWAAGSRQPEGQAGPAVEAESTRTAAGPAGCSKLPGWAGRRYQGPAARNPSERDRAAQN